METNLPAQTGIDIVAIQDIIGTAPEVLTTNQTSNAKAIEFANNLIKNKNEVGMSDALDAQMASFINKGKVTITAMNERRKPFTQMMDMLKKEFTGMETGLKAKLDEMQGYRNEFATEKMRKRQEEERRQALILAKQKEIITLKGEAEMQLRNSFADYLAKTKQEFTAWFNALDSENITAAETTINVLSEEYPSDLFLASKIDFTGIVSYTSQEDMNAIIANAKTQNLLNEFKSTFRESIREQKRELSDKLPSKIAELEALAVADAEEKQRLEKAAQKRAEEEEARIVKQQEEAKQKALENIAATTAAETVGATIDSQATLFEEAPKVKEGVEMVVKSPVAYALIFQFWFEKEGKSLSAEKIEKKSIGQMKKFCEDYSLKTGEIINNPLISYKDVFKAK